MEQSREIVRIVKKCQYCGDLVERVNVKGKVTCFSCKKKRLAAAIKNGKKATKNKVRRSINTRVDI